MLASSDGTHYGGVESFQSVNNSATGHTFVVFEESRYDTNSWFLARKLCRQKVSPLADLAEITDESDVTTVHDLLLTSGALNDAYWIGFHNFRILPATHLVGSLHTGQPLTLDKWDGPRPKTDTVRRCGTVKRDNDKWRDETCSSGSTEYGVLCWFPIQPSTIDPHTGCPPTMLPFDGKCYDFQMTSEKVNFTTARQTCEALPEGRMVIPNTTMQEFVTRYAILSGVANFWLGVTDQEVDGEYKGIYGEALDSPKWYYFDDRNPNSKTDCVFISSNTGDWSTGDCGYQRGILCVVDPLAYEASTSQQSASSPPTTDTVSSTASATVSGSMGYLTTTPQPTTHPTTIMATTTMDQGTTAAGLTTSTNLLTRQSTGHQSTGQSTNQASDQSTGRSTTLPPTSGIQTEVVGVTPSWCSLAVVNSYQTAIECSNASGNDISLGKLSNEEKKELQDFLKLIGSLPSDVYLKFSETDAIAELVLEVFVKLTDQDQKSSLEEEMDILADTEEALKLLAGTLHPQTCTTVKIASSSTNLCHASSSTLDGYTYTHNVDINPDDPGENTASYEEKVEFNLPIQDPDAGEVKLVILRKERVVQPSDSIYYQLHELEAPNKTWIELNSAFLTFSIYEEDLRKSVPVIFSLSHLTDVVNGSLQLQNSSVTVNTTRKAICAFWDAGQTNPTTKWSSRGCELVPAKSAKSFTQCSCNHSTSFAVLMQVKEYEISSVDSLVLTWITYIGCSTSMVMLVLTLTVFCYLGSMLKSDRIFIHTNLSIAILLAQILFIAGIDRTENRIVCKVVALSLHFSYLSVFGWMMVEGVHLYLKVVRVYGSENIKMYPYLLIGWGIPGIITLVSFGASNDGYGTGTSCWLDISSGLIWAFVAPALVVIAINMIVLLLVVRIVIKSAHLNKEKHYDHIKAGIKGAIVLLPILGLTWVFGLLAVNSDTIIFQYLFTIFNSFQGLFIFLIHCVFNSEVKAALKRKRDNRKLNNERNTMENSMSFVYSSKKSTDTQSTSNTVRRNLHRETTDTTSLSSGTSSRPGSGTSLFVVTPIHKHKKRPHSGHVAPMPITEADDEALLHI